MPNIGLKTVLAHEYDGEATASAGECLHVQSVALPIGDEEHVVCLGSSRDAGKSSSNLGPARGLAQPSNKRLEAVAALCRPNVSVRIVELPEVDHVRVVDPGGDRLQTGQDRLVLGHAPMIRR